jgi:hypothetical protein
VKSFPLYIPGQRETHAIIGSRKRLAASKPLEIRAMTNVVLDRFHVHCYLPNVAMVNFQLLKRDFEFVLSSIPMKHDMA